MYGVVVVRGLCLDSVASLANWSASSLVIILLCAFTFFSVSKMFFSFITYKMLCQIYHAVVFKIFLVDIFSGCVVHLLSIDIAAWLSVLILTLEFLGTASSAERIANPSAVVEIFWVLIGKLNFESCIMVIHADPLF